MGITTQDPILERRLTPDVGARRLKNYLQVLTMELTTGLLIVAGLFLLILVPYLVYEIRRGKAHGHTWFTWFKPRGHSDIGPDVGVRYTEPGVDEARGARH